MNDSQETVAIIYSSIVLLLVGCLVLFVLFNSIHTITIYCEVHHCLQSCHGTPFTDICTKGKYNVRILIANFWMLVAKNIFILSHWLERPL